MAAFSIYAVINTLLRVNKLLIYTIYLNLTLFPCVITFHCIPLHDKREKVDKGSKVLWLIRIDLNDL